MHRRPTSSRRSADRRLVRPGSGTLRAAAGLSLLAAALGAFAPATTVVAALRMADDGPRAGMIVPGPESVRAFRPEEPGTGEAARSAGRLSGAMLPEIFAGMRRESLDWFHHVATLTSPFFEGRAGGLPGFDRAIEYIRVHFERLGLEPAFTADGDTADPTFIQRFTYPAGRSERSVELEAAAFEALGRTMTHGRDYTVLAASGGTAVTAPLVFVGYGIESGPGGYTSFAEEADLTGRIAVLLRYEPLNDEGGSQWAARRFSPQAGLMRKYQAVASRQAAGILLVNPVGASDGARGLETLVGSAQGARSLDVPVLHITPEVADALLRAASGDDTGLEEWQARANAGPHAPWALADTVTVTAEGRSTISGGATEWPSANVGAVLRGSGDLADEWIIVGGHHDHLGYGRSGSRTPQRRGELHAGADDNASGTAGVLVLASLMTERYRDRADAGPRRSIMFLTFGAEEAGLYGSAHFIDHPPIPLTDVTFMLNLDMIGRLRDGNVSLSGTGTAEEFDSILPRLIAQSGLTVSASAGGRGPSDHANFYRAGMPVLFFFTGLHDEYHTPDDTLWTVNAEGAAEVIDLASEVLEEIATLPTRLTFRRGEQRLARGDAAPAAEARRDRPRLGIVIEDGAGDGAGVLIADVVDGSAAATAGLRGGDRIIRWDREDVTGNSVAPFLARHMPGDDVRLTIRRGEETMTVVVRLDASP